MGPAERSGADGDGADATRERLPYGRLTSCRVLHRQAYRLAEVTSSAFLLLETQVGLVAIRVDFVTRQAGNGRGRAHAVELTAVEVPADALSADERQRLMADIVARGGVRRGAWALHYPAAT